jgi:LysM repeat protein
MPSRRFRSVYGFLLLVIAGLLVVTPIAGQDSSTTHVVQRGETLYRIALRYGVGVDALAKANNITNPSHILAGQTLVIPTFDASQPTVENPTVAGTPTTHIVAPGETLASIAAAYGMTTDQLMQINDIANPNIIYRGQKLTVWSNAPADTTQLPAPDQPQIDITAPLTSITTPEPNAILPTPTIEPALVPTAVPTSQTYVVQRGDGLAKIARKFGIDWTAIAQANSISDPNQIYAGQTLVIPTSNTPSDLGISTNDTAIIGNGVDPNLPFPPTPTILVGKQVVVVLSQQRMYAFDNGNLVRELSVSTGLPGSPTVLGDYKVYQKLTAQRMVGPGYDLPGVPYVMYFYQGYALHGTYWHNNFGHPMSHGCVNMPTPEAEWFYNNFVEIGTPIHVQY